MWYITKSLTAHCTAPQTVKIREHNSRKTRGIMQDDSRMKDWLAGWLLAWFHLWKLEHNWATRASGRPTTRAIKVYSQENTMSMRIKTIFKNQPKLLPKSAVLNFYFLIYFVKNRRWRIICASGAQ